MGEESGWVMDFQDIKEAFAPLLSQLDHHYLNEVEGLANPASENLARWIWERLTGTLPLSAIVVRQTRTSGCIYRVLPTSLFERPAAELCVDDSAQLGDDRRQPDHIA